MRRRLSRGMTIAALTLGIALLGFAGISLALSGGDPTGQSAQTAIGAIGSPPGTLNSAPNTLNQPGEVAEQFEEAPGSGGGENPSNAPGEGSGSAPAAATGSGSGSGSGSLPFTGLLAIPVLLAGLALLVTGMMLRRREATPVQS